MSLGVTADVEFACHQQVSGALQLFFDSKLAISIPASRVFSVEVNPTCSLLYSNWYWTAASPMVYFVLAGGCSVQYCSQNGKYGLIPQCAPRHFHLIHFRMVDCLKVAQT